MKTNIYLTTYIKNNHTCELEVIQLPQTSMPEEGIIEFVNNVYGFNDYDLYYSYLDFDHFYELCVATLDNKFIQLKDKT